MTERKWTIGIVNYQSSVYLEWQLKILNEFNDRRTFQLIIVDNSMPHEREALEALRKQYATDDNIQIIYHTPVTRRGSEQHGEGLNRIRPLIDTPYTLFQDPDFFWVQKNHLNFLEAQLETGCAAVGAPYPRKIGIGDPYFPSAWGCAYHSHLIRDLDFSADGSEEGREESFARFPVSEFEFSFDVGWKVREALSPQGSIAFQQRAAWVLPAIMGRHSFELLPVEYRVDRRIVAYHLFRGTFPGDVSVVLDSSDYVPTPDEWNDVRRRYGRLFYNLVKTDQWHGFWSHYLFIHSLRPRNALSAFVLGMRRKVSRTLRSTSLGNRIVDSIRYRVRRGRQVAG